jgi:hypothetical protein
MIRGEISCENINWFEVEQKQNQFPKCVFARERVQRKMPGSMYQFKKMLRNLFKFHYLCFSVCT